ncbi:carbamoyl-phosphate synthase [Nesterenkonia sp. HG001]|uniref:carboxylate--amine ligase n=1 Tax=Nesterenkonia sp. HG001 TaxID=2983207 RepID=UPI002AC5977E|nr:carbamoyl-phosphate synthase [Nesterenkonia sp. HG001]MDZ5078295.1 carbamoyl-phosphate synthase [Nesterenkonia sp. HG001]
MRIPQEQAFVPVITGGDVGTYSLAREFHEAFGAISAIIPTTVNRNLKHSRILEAFPAGSMTTAEPVIAKLKEVAALLTDDGARPRPLLLLANYDHLVRFAVDHRAELEAVGYTIPYPSAQLLDRVALKENFYALCEELGVPYPKTAAYDCAAHTEQRAQSFAAEELAEAGVSFPLVLKAGDGGAWADISFEGRRKVHYVDDAEELTGLLGKAAGAGYTGVLIAQEHIPGPDSQLRLATFFSDQTGRVRLTAFGEVIVEDHAPGLEGNSPAVLTSRDEAVEKQGAALLRAIGWRGFAMFDIKVDPRDGVAKFFELNPRLGRNHHYLTASGVNPARLYVEEHLRGGLGGPDHQVAKQPALHTTLPLPLVKKHASADQLRRITALAEQGRIVNPFFYDVDSDLRRTLYHRAMQGKAFRTYRQHPPPVGDLRKSAQLR